MAATNAFQPHRQCKACIIIFQEAGDDNPSTSKLYQRFIRVQKNALTLKQLDRDLKAEGHSINYSGLQNHVKRHQNPDNARALTPQAKVAKTERQVVQALEGKQLHHSDRRTAALDKLTEMLAAGELKGGTFTALANLLKQESDIEEKAKDRTLEMAKLFNSYIGNPLAKDAIEGEAVEPQ